MTIDEILLLVAAALVVAGLICHEIAKHELRYGDVDDIEVPLGKERLGR